MDPLEQSTQTASHTDRFMSRFVDFETVADASAATAGAPAGEAPSGTDPAAASPGGAGGGETVPPAVATEAAPAGPPNAWSADDPTFLDAVDSRALELMDQRFGPLQQLIQQSLAGDQGQAGAAQLGQELLPPDPFSDNYPAELAAWQQQREERMLSRFEQMLGQVAQPLQQRIESETVAEGNQRLADMLADDISRNGEFPRAPGETESRAQQLVQPLAEMIFPQVVARYGNGPMAAERAMAQAAATIRALVTEAGAAAVEAHKNQLATLSGVRGEPAGAGAAGAQTVTDGPLDARALALKFGGRAEVLRTGNNGA